MPPVISPAIQIIAKLDKGDWLPGGAAVLGILGVGYGFWWADSAAAAIISFTIIGDGWDNLRNAVAQLMNKRPTDVETQQADPVIDQVQSALQRLDWVSEARVRLREDGDILTGDVYIVPGDQTDLLPKLEQARALAESLDWRLHDINIVPVRNLAR